MDDLDFKPIVARILRLLDSDYRTKIEFCNYLGKSRQILYDWKEGNTTPTLLNIYKASKYFGVPMEYLISGDESPIDDTTAAFIVQTRDLTEDQKKIIFASIKAQVDMFKSMNSEKQ